MKFYKNLILFLMCLFTFLGCGDNNKGPFRIENNGQNKILLSAEKPASGLVTRVSTSNTEYSQVQYKDGIPSGNFTLYFDNIPFLIGEGKWKNNDFNGKITYTNMDKKVIEKATGNFNFNKTNFSLNSSSMNLKDFLIQYYGDNFVKFTIENNIIKGEVEISNFSHQLISKYSIEQYQINGERIDYYTNGNVQTKTNYKNGILNGAYEVYYENGGIKIRGTYLNGVKSGPYTEFFENGNTMLKTSYTNGEPDGTTITYYENGQLNSELTYIDGVAQGDFIGYYPNGQLKLKGTFKDNKINGKYTVYNEDGSIKESGNYINGEKEGTFGGYFESFKNYIGNVLN